MKQTDKASLYQNQTDSKHLACLLTFLFLFTEGAEVRDAVRNERQSEDSTPQQP